MDKLFALYPNSWNADNLSLKKRQYLSALDNPKVEFFKLFDRIAKHHMGEFMPIPQWLREQSKFCYKEEYKKANSEWVCVKVYDPILKEIRNTDCFPVSATPEKILNFYKKKFGGEGWKIEEIKAF